MPRLLYNDPVTTQHGHAGRFDHYTPSGDAHINLDSGSVLITDPTTLTRRPTSAVAVGVVVVVLAVAGAAVAGVFGQVLLCVASALLAAAVVAAAEQRRRMRRQPPPAGVDQVTSASAVRTAGIKSRG